MTFHTYTIKKKTEQINLENGNCFKDDIRKLQFYNK